MIPILPLGDRTKRNFKFFCQFPNCHAHKSSQILILDSDLAKFYEIPSKRLNEQVRRNTKRFPDDFMFQLNQPEYDSLRSQIATLKLGRGGHHKYTPLVFTEQGVALLSSILRNERALEVNVAIMRAFVQLRRQSAINVELFNQVRQINEKVDLSEKKHDDQFKLILDEIQQVMSALSLHALPALPQTEAPVTTKSEKESSHSKAQIETKQFRNVFLSTAYSAKVNAIIYEVATHFGLKGSSLKAPSRIRTVVLPRQIAFYLIRKHIGIGYKEIGGYFGGQDHTTTLHAFRKISEALGQDGMIREAVHTIERLLLDGSA